jgi:hypothetical protein
MPWHLRAQPAAFGRRMTPFFRRPGRFATVLILAALALAQGCVAVPSPPVVSRDPSSPSARTPPVGYRSTVAPYVSRRPAEPTPWQEQNERVAPPARPAE